MIATLEDAQYEVCAIRADFDADNDEDMEIDHADAVVAACFSIDDNAIALELCRVELSYVPRELERRLGARDWLAS